MIWSVWRSWSPRTRKLLLWALGVLLVYTLLGFLILPPIVRAVAVKQLAGQLDRQVSITKVKLNPFVLSTTIRGLLIKDKDGQPFVSWDEVYVNFQLSSFLGHAWVFKEVSLTRPFVRVQVNKDYTLNCSDLITKFSSNAPPTKPIKPPKPLALRIDRFHIAGAAAALTDLTPRTPFHRVIGPLDVTLVHFRTDPNNENPYSFAGTTDAGENFAWAGYFYLDPLRSGGQISLQNVALNKYAPLYQDLVRFEIRDGVIDLSSTYLAELSASNRIASVTNTQVHLRSFKLAQPGSETNVVELPEFSISGVSADAIHRRAEVRSVAASGARLALRRGQDNAINVIELSKPAEGATNAPGAVLLLLHSVTNAVALLLNSTNLWSATIDEVNFQDCALNLEDLANSRPARLELDQIALTAKRLSNLPGANLSASLSLRWNTNGTIKTGIEGSFSPPRVSVDLALDQLELRSLDPYLEPKLNLFILGSKLGLQGQILLLATNDQLPQVTFRGDARLDDFSTVDGVLAEDLLKWRSFRVSGIDANLNPPAVSVREVALDDAYARVIIETNHTINLLAALRLTDTNAPPLPAKARPATSARDKKTREAQPAAVPAAKAPDAAASPKISVASVVISNAQIRFTDRSLTPNASLAIDQVGGAITGLSSETLGHADLDIQAKVDNVGPVHVTGSINPLNLNQTNDIKIVVKNVDLTPTSPYVGKFAGYRLAQGKLDMDLDYHLYERKIQAKNLIVLDRFTFGDKVNSPEATKLPVRLAIAILKDRDGKIQLDVPVEGSLDDPQFRLHKVIVRAIENLLTKIATSPFSVLGALFGGKGEEISYQDFAPGSSALEASSKDKLESLLKGLYQRPALQLEIAGSVAPDADRDGLRRLALERRLRTRKWLSLRKSEKAVTAPEQVALTPEERPHWLKEIYAEALSKGQIRPSINVTNPGAAASTLPAVALLRLGAPDLEKGASQLMERPGTNAPAPGAAATASPAKPARAIIADTMEQALLDSIAITDSDLGALAAERAKAVRDYLLASGKVEPERLFLAESPSDTVKSEGSRVYLQLK